MLFWTLWFLEIRKYNVGILFYTYLWIFYVNQSVYLYLWNSCKLCSLHLMLQLINLLLINFETVCSGSTLSNNLNLIKSRIYNVESLLEICWSFTNQHNTMWYLVPIYLFIYLFASIRNEIQKLKLLFTLPNYCPAT